MKKTKQNVVLAVILGLLLAICGLAVVMEWTWVYCTIGALVVAGGVLYAIGTMSASIWLSYRLLKIFSTLGSR